jgi:hypothetical protein
MAVELLLAERFDLSGNSFVALRIWHFPTPVRGSSHRFKYSLAYIVCGECVLRYDNEAGKGDHRHICGDEKAYDFTSIRQLQADFWADVDEWRLQ